MGQAMIASLSGTLRVRDAGRVVIETAGVGYEVFIPLSTYYRLPSMGSAVYLEIRQIVRDDALLLYGFSDSIEKRTFDLLLGVQHVGPKAALSILSVLSPEDLVKAISREDIHRIDAVPGVGTKLAERIVRELRDKIANLKFGGDARPVPSPNAATQNGAGAIVDDAVSALINLAYKPIQAQRAVDLVLADNASADLETIIRKSLAILLAEK
jgi:Holliday junction DNA helicase RuvA